MPHQPHILFIARASLYSQPGGDTIHLEQTAKYLRKLGYMVDVHVSSASIPIQEYDIVHFFNVIRPADVLPYLAEIKILVVSSIYVDYFSHERKYGASLRRVLSWMFGKDGMEYLKVLARWLKGNDKFPGWHYLIAGHRASMKRVLEKAAVVLTASQYESAMIKAHFPELDISMRSINLGTEHFEAISPAPVRSGVTMVARIERLKNQLNLIKAINNSSHQLNLYGQAAANQNTYLKECRKLASNQVRFMGQVDQQSLPKILSQTKIHALPSFFETTGLASLEALAAGCQIVVADHPIQHELFGTRAHYCNPHKPESIGLAIAAATQSSDDHREWLKANFSWHQAALKISDLYQKLSQA